MSQFHSGILVVAMVFLFVIGGASALGAADTPSSSLRVYIGTYTGPDKGKGIYLYDFDLASGALKEVAVAAEVASPSFLALSRDETHLYSIGEVSEFKGKREGAVSAFSVDRATGKLTLLNQQPSGGDGPCHVSITSDGKVVLVANYTGGSVASFPVQADGKLGEAASVIQHTGKGTDLSRQSEPHAHGIWPAPGDVFVITCDLGLDKVISYRCDLKTGALAKRFDDGTTGDVPPGHGARHAAFSPNTQNLYVINEMGNSMTVFSWDAKAGAMVPIQTIDTLPMGFPGKSYCAEVVVHPSGKFVYGSNRGHDSITVFSADKETGKLTFVDNTKMAGKWPRNFNVDPTGQWLIAAGEHSGTLEVFKIDPATGKLTPTGEPVKCPQPGCVIFAKKE